MNLLQQSGAQAQKQPKYVPIFIDRCFTGIYTQRSVLHDPSDVATARFYGGRPDALIDGSNVELTNRLTLQRRPGLTPFSTATYPTPPDRCFSFELTDGTIQVLVDTTSTPVLDLFAVDVISGSVFYLFTNPEPQADNNAYEGLDFQIAGFDEGVNNGTFTCLASTVNYLILNNPVAITDVAGSSIPTPTAISAGAVYFDHQSGGIKTLLFAKSPGAGQTHFVAVAGTCYMGDGVDIRKYTPGNTNGAIWDWGSAAPTNPPSVSIVAAGSAAIQWVAATVFSTMGVVFDANGNTQQLFSVNAKNDNPPPATLGTSGNGAPAFNTSLGGTTTDGSVTWTSQGSITLWTANTTYVSGAPIFDPTTNCIFVQSHSDTRKSGPTKPAFNSTLGIGGARIDDTAPNANARWECLGVVNGSPTVVKTWAKNTAFNKYDPPSSGIDPNHVNAAIVFPLIPNQANMLAFAAGTGPAIFLLGATTAGTTANVNYTPWTGIPAQVAGNVTLDNQLEWLCLGSSTWASLTQYTAWTTSGTVFSCIKDSNGNIQVCVTGGQSGSIQPTWQTAHGSITQDNDVTWTNEGPASPNWAINTQWYLPLAGFSPDRSSQPHGGAEVVGSNFIQGVIASGLSQTPGPPAWSVTIGNTTVDGGVTWITLAPFSQQSLVWTKGHVYAYSYEARLATDFYNTNTPPGGRGPLGPPTGSESGLITTASPVFTITGSNTGAVNTVSGIGSTDPQIDTIVIWRDADGGGSANMFFLTEINAPKPVAGVAQPWSFQDFLPDLPTATFPGLNNLIPAPIDDQNDPPPSAFLPMVYNFQRIFGADSSSVLWSGGPDVIVGNPQEAFNPTDNFEYLARVVRIVKTSQGLVILLTDSVEFLGGGPQTASFYTVTLSPGIGMQSYNALDIYAGEIFFISSDSQFKTINPQLILSTTGFPIGDQIANMNPSIAYVAVQQAGVDNALYLADGSTGWWRVNPHQITGGYSGPEAIWSPFATITGGTQMVQSVETSPGVKKLLVGGTGPNQQILERNLSVYTDNGIQYDANFIMGSIVLTHPGQIALLKFIEADFNGVQYHPVMSYLLNEISGNFTIMPTSVPDPPSLYGTTSFPLTYSPNRFYFAATGSLARARHMQIKVDFGKTSNGDEIANLTIFGRLMVEI